MEVKFKEIEIDFSTINNIEEMHIVLQEKFGFPHFYGKNLNALIDCLSSLRYPEDKMSSLFLDSPNEVLFLKTKKLSSKSIKVLQCLLLAIESVNSRYILKGQTPCIVLSLN